MNADMDMELRTTMEFVKDMGMGINLGNTFDCSGDWIAKTVRAQETAWGSPVITKEMIKCCADVGFGVMRLPVSWTVLMDGDGNIDKDFMDRIDEVVGRILDSGMCCILNSHHDGWAEKFTGNYDGTMRLYTGMWEQIAGRFNKYGEKLMLESMNEVGFDTVWNRYGGTDGKQKAFDMFGKINQKFVDVIRGSGGNNESRHLLIASYWTAIECACDDVFVLPDDPAGRLAVSIHYYGPPTLCLISEDVEWGRARTDWGSQADYDELNMLFDMMKEKFIDRGTAVIVGEYGCFGDNKTRETREKWTLDVGTAAHERQMCPILWDTPGGEFNRNKCCFEFPGFIERLVAIGNS